LSRKVVENYDENMSLMVRTQGASKKWMVRIYFPKARQYLYRSLKLDYEDSNASLNEARRRAGKIYDEEKPRIAMGDSATTVRYVKNVADAYLKDALKMASENESLSSPIHFIKGSRGERPWTLLKAEAVKNIHNHLAHYWPTLRHQEFSKLKELDLADFQVWAMRHDPSWSPSWINRCITEIRKIWLFGMEKGWTDFVPSPKRRSEDIKERRRRSLNIEEWFSMIEWARDRYNSLDGEHGTFIRQKDSALQFWAWLNFVSWTGFRPPNGNVRKNLVRWSDISTNKEGIRFLRRDEKDHDYKITIDPKAYPFLDFLKDLQERKKIETEFVFAHFSKRMGSHEIGDPILSFRTSWNTMLKELGLWMPWGSSPTEKLVPYSLRGFAMTMAIDRNEASALQIAANFGTSVKMLEQTYYDFDPEKVFAKLIKNSNVVIEEKVKYDKNGFPILR